MTKKFVVLGWITTIIFLFLYSFTQIDLGLTLTRVSWWQVIQKNFQYIGYFQRPLSTALYLGILFLLFFFYWLLLRLIRNNKVSLIDFKFLVIITVGILLLAYPAFSYDIFNYIFDAKTIIVYHKNPYQFKPLDFPGDPMLGFMHWTHRPSIFPPLWIGLTLPFYILGFGQLILQIISFKIISAFFYLATLYLIYKISRLLKIKNFLFSLAFYAFNPLVLIESLVSGHNDGVMVFFSLLTFYFLLKKKYLKSFFSWFLSIALKYSSAILLPLFIFHRREKYLLKMAIALISLAILIVTHFYLGFQPWYFLWVFPFAALLPPNSAWLTLLGCLSLGALLRYSPFLYLGNWNPPVPVINFWLVIVFLVLGLVIAGLAERYFKE